MKKQKAKKSFSKHWITIWLVISILLIAVIGAFAVYADVNNKMKRVIAPSDKKDSLFTSNYLSSGTSNIRYVYFNAEDTPFGYDVIIRNYSPSDPGNVYDGIITYTLKAELAHKNGTSYLEATGMNGEEISLTCGEDTITINSSNLSEEIDQELSGSGEGGRKIWTISYTNIPLGSDYCIKLTAIPDNDNLQTISATIIIDNYPQAHREGWSCTLVESGNLSDYDAFNYTIIGTGAANLIFSYDESKVQINPAFYTLNSEVDAPTANTQKGGNWKKVVIHADPDSTQINRYDIQLYKVNSFQPSSSVYIDPNEEGSYVEFTTDVYTTP